MRWEFLIIDATGRSYPTRSVENFDEMGGASGVDRTLQILRDELSTTLGLCGQTSIRKLTPDLIRRVDY